MQLLKSIGAGIAADFLAGVLSIVGALAFASLRLWLMMHTESAGSAGIGAVSVGVPGVAIIAAPVGFAIGFYWQFRHKSRLRASEK